MGTDTENEVGTTLIKNYGQFFKQQYQELATVCNDHFWEENKSFCPIQIIMKPIELTPITGLLSSDNTVMSKVLSVLVSLCVEVVQLKQEAFERHFPFLAVYEEYSATDISTQTDAVCALGAFVSRCDETLLNLCSQMFAVFTKQVVNINGIQLHYMINHCGELLTLVALTELLVSRCALPRHWSRHVTRLRETPPSLLSLPPHRYQAILNAVDNITSKIMNDDIVQNTLGHLAPLKKFMVDKNCSVIASEFSHYLRQAAVNLDKLIQEKPNSNTMYKCIKLNALYVLSMHLFGNTDTKFFKTLSELNIKAHSVHVVGTALWFPEQFLQRHVPACAAPGRLSPALQRARQTYVYNKKAGLSRDVAAAHTTCLHWILKVEETFGSGRHELCASEIGTHADILLEGVDIIAGIQHSAVTLINLHLSLGMPLSKSTVKALFEHVDTIKAFQNAVNRNAVQITRSVNMVVQHLLFQAMISVLDVKKTLMADRNATKKLDELTCIVIAERALRGSASLERSVAANIALSFIPNSVYMEDTYARLGALLEKVQTLTNWTVTVEHLCDCSWMSCHQNVIPVYFEQNFPTDLTVARLEYFMTVFQDCSNMFYKTDPIFGKDKCTEFVGNIRSLIRESILDTYAQSIETNLRLHIHSHLQLDVINPFTTDMTKKLLLAIDKLRLQCIYIEVVPSVEHYLSTMFYNLTTVVLSDWKTYGEMRQLARFKFNLETVRDDLPTQTLEQGLDVLEIMRNIHVFVSKYLYNLNNQIFVEKSSNNKHLNSINIQHIANSIRTHGTGIMNTTVNFTYQFLKKKFFTFSQFMYDEHIKSRLMKDLRIFRESKDDMYKYKNAERFNKGIKALGVDSDGQSYLDLFRDLISQIGNAMGYVRMVRSGGRHACSDATVFLPSLESVSSFTRLCQADNLTPNTVAAADNLDQNIEGLISNFIEGTEYFKLLVEVFAPVFRNPKNVHLKNFFVIVPPLTLNHVEHMMLSKDRMTKKDKAGAAFTDDGFCMGVACILKLLDQDSEFESLQWFSSVWRHIGQQRHSLAEQTISATPQLQQTLALTERKLNTVEDEYRLLYYTLTSARIFFR